MFSNLLAASSSLPPPKGQAWACWYAYGLEPFEDWNKQTNDNQFVATRLFAYFIFVDRAKKPSFTIKFTNHTQPHKKKSGKQG